MGPTVIIGLVSVQVELKLDLPTGTELGNKIMATDCNTDRSCQLQLQLQGELLLGTQLDLSSCKSSLASWATKWHYYVGGTHPAGV